MIHSRRWPNVWTIFRREVRDQLRDRRTLFMVFALPLLLYPLLAIGMLQIAATRSDRSREVVVVGAENLPDMPALLNPKKDGFDPSLFPSRKEARSINVILAESGSFWTRDKAAREAVRNRLANAVIVIPPEVRSRVDQTGSVQIPILFDSTDEASLNTRNQIRDVLEGWRDVIVEGRLTRDGKPPGYNNPVKVASEDVAPEGKIGVNVWARIFPFLLVLMSLTGAFYPSVDLCAGEKERGTMETLLISPAARSEIVLGKFFTVMLASVMTAILNLVSMGLTGIQIAGKLAASGSGGGAPISTIVAPPALSSYFWMLILLIPLSAFFSAICVALAVLARSMKEGQYYMTPLYLVSLPLILVTLMPEVSLNLFYSMVPITGVSLLLKSLILGEFTLARQYFLPVLLPTIVYSWLALKWAVDLFKREDVVFREAEGFDLRLWLRHLVRDKEPTPGAGPAILCFALMLSLTWFLMQTFSATSPLRGMVVGHIAIVGPPLALTLLLCSDPVRTLRLNLPRLRDLALAGGLALTLNPLVREVAYAVGRIFPASQAIQEQLGEMGRQVPNLTVAVLIFALMPAITEEVAFRGFILTGLGRTYKTGTAIILSAFLFGFLHVLLSLFQQLFGATILGLVLGLIAIRTRSLWPGVLFHFINNAIGVLIVDAAKDPRLESLSAAIFRDPSEALFRVPIIAVTSLISLGLLAILWRGGIEGRGEGPGMIGDPGG
ncbi:ABC transporter permease subunit/CPBP intramembrane protease [Tundrisphaera lichenicola]|uniref:ABC transporter permease subunit/CPBP intramembrane protease n=1 Tax=Tundrisphaera lichenicola TaxID=2029860 RepID=UPI003EC0E7DC